MLFLAKATTPHRFRPSAVRCRTLWTVDCTTTAPSTKLSAATWDVITATDSGSLANNRRVRVTQFYCQNFRVVGLESWTWTQVGLEFDFLRTWTGLGLEGQGLGLGLGLER